MHDAVRAHWQMVNVITFAKQLNFSPLNFFPSEVRSSSAVRPEPTDSY